MEHTAMLMCTFAKIEINSLKEIVITATHKRKLETYWIQCFSSSDLIPYLSLGTPPALCKPFPVIIVMVRGNSGSRTVRQTCDMSRVLSEMIQKNIFGNLPTG